MNANTMGPWSSFLVLLLLVAGQNMANAQLVVRMCTINFFRQETLYRPSSYDLKLRVNPTLKTFTGNVKIDLKTTQLANRGQVQQNIEADAYPWDMDPRNIILNAENLEVTDVQFHQDQDTPVVTRVCQDKGNKLLIVRLDKLMSSEQGATLSFEFTGKSKADAKGLFRSSVGSSHALVTQLMPAYARRLFPCFDEPRFKAKFKLTVVHPPGTIALSNMPIIEHTTPPDDYATTEFDATPEMSSYLLSLAVGEFDLIASDDRIGGTKIAIHAPKGTECANHMLAEAAQAYEMARGFFAGLKQPLKKIDIVAVNMGHAVMEGWGLITMRLDLLCKELAKPEDRIYAVMTLTNQIVRFWLGNLVSVFVWNDLWFMEGLANYVTTELTTKLHPEMSSELLTLIDITHSVMKDDDDPRKTRPIQGPPHRPDKFPLTAIEVEKSFDSVIYKKSEAVFRMFAQFLGKQNFNLAIRELIRVNAYRCSNGDGWQSHLASAARPFRQPDYQLSGSDMMKLVYNHWTKQAGYPIITASVNGEGKLVVSQQSNLGNRDTWPVPISYKLYTGSTEVLSETRILLHRSAKFNMGINLENGQDWIKLNVDYQGYYRVCYQTESLRLALHNALKHGYMQPADRMDLLSDSYAHSKRRNSMDGFGRLLKLFENDTHDGVILLLIRILTDLHENNFYWTYSEQVTKLLMNYYNKTGGVSGEDDSNCLRQYTRGKVLDYLVNGRWTRRNA